MPEKDQIKNLHPYLKEEKHQFLCTHYIYNLIFNWMTSAFINKVLEVSHANWLRIVLASPSHCLLLFPPMWAGLVKRLLERGCHWSVTPRCAASHWSIRRGGATPGSCWGSEEAERGVIINKCDSTNTRNRKVQVIPSPDCTLGGFIKTFCLRLLCHLSLSFRFST